LKKSSGKSSVSCSKSLNPLATALKEP
jgi:hypothetical protein